MPFKATQDSVAYVMHLFVEQPQDEQYIRRYTDQLTRIYGEFDRRSLLFPGLPIGGEPGRVRLSKNFLHFNKICPLVQQRIGLKKEYELQEMIVPECATLESIPNTVDVKALRCDARPKNAEVVFVRDMGETESESQRTVLRALPVVSV